ncbi:MAG: flavodoxin [Burkholderiaceae bacterium]
MAKTLIVYHSRTGYTRRVAYDLAGRLGADLDAIRIVQPMHGALGYAMCAIEAIAGLAPALRPPVKNPDAYDLVVVGTPVWFWSLASPVRSWLETFGHRGKRFAFFCTMGSSGAERVFAAIKEMTGREPVATLALTDAEIDATARAKLDAFVNELRAGTGRRAAARRVKVHAVA